jgi:saccharopine dehydrogenase (NAD+, L-lysine-forming)
VKEVRVGVLGAAGTIAPAIIRDLAESDEVGSLLLLDRDEERMTAVAERHVPSDFDLGVAAVDANDGLAVALEGCDILVNSASYRMNLTVMQACLEAGCHYIDLGGLYWLTADQQAMNDEFHQAGLLALLGMGSSPGKTNVMARRACRELTGSDSGPVESIDVIAGGRDLTPPDGFSAPYAVRTLIDELTLAPIVIRDGEPVEVEPLSSGGVIDFPEPIGPAESIHTIHSEMRTFGESFGCRTGAFKLSLAPALLEKLRELTTASQEEQDRVGRSALPPSAGTVSIHMIDAATAEGSGCRVTAITSPIEAWGLGGGVISTAAPAAAAVRLIARGAIDATGAMPPERCVDPDDLFPELEQRSCRFEVQTTTREVSS